MSRDMDTLNFGQQMDATDPDVRVLSDGELETAKAGRAKVG